MISLDRLTRKGSNFGLLGRDTIGQLAIDTLKIGRKVAQWQRESLEEALLGAGDQRCCTCQGVGTEEGKARVVISQTIGGPYDMGLEGQVDTVHCKIVDSGACRNELGVEPQQPLTNTCGINTEEEIQSREMREDQRIKGKLLCQVLKGPIWAIWTN